MNLWDRLMTGPSLEERQLVQVVPSWNAQPESLGFSNAKAYLVSSTVHAVMNARMKVFAEVRFAWRRANGDIAPGRNLQLLERPWPGGTGTELLARMVNFADLSGNAYVYKADNDRLQVLDPWKVEVLDNGREKTGYLWLPDGPGGREVPLPLERVAHWAPLPHPEKRWLGASWVSVVADEFRTDLRMLHHMEKFYTNAATPNMVVTFKEKLSADSKSRLREELDRRYSGVQNAYRNLVMDHDPTIQMVGATAEQADQINTQKSIEARIASAGGVPPIIIGLKAGLDAATYSNYGMAMRAFADHTIRPLWNSVVAALEPLVSVPRGSELWFDDRQVAALRQDKNEEAQIQATQAATIRTYIDAGYTPESAVTAVTSGDLTVLEHTGLFSVQLQEPGTEQPMPETPPEEGDNQGESDE